MRSQSIESGRDGSHLAAPRSPMGVTLSSRWRCFVMVRGFGRLAMDAADLAEKSEAEGRKLRRASNFSRSLIGGGRVRFAFETRVYVPTAYAHSLQPPPC
jgi:hypothetical protein